MDPSENRGPSVLYVPQDPDSAVAAVLAGLTSVDACRTGESVLEALDRVAPDALVVELTGYGRTHEALVAAREAFPDLPIVALVPGVAFVDDAHWRGATDALVKTEADGAAPQDLALRVIHAVRRCVTGASIRKNRDILDQIIDLNPYAIGIYNRGGYMVRCNRAFIHLFGGPTPPGVSIFDHAQHKDSDSGRAIEAVFRGEQAYSPPVRFNPGREIEGGPDRDLFVSTVVFPLMDASGEVEHIVAMYEDVTVRAQAEEALRAAHDRLEVRVRERTGELQAELERRRRLEKSLLEKNRELEDFSFRVGHDLKNDVLAIRCLVEASGGDPARLAESAEDIVAQSRHLIEFVDRLLHMARAGKVLRKKEPTDVARLYREVFERTRRPVGDVELILCEPMPDVMADPDALAQVFANLLNNSLQFRDPEKPALRITVSAGRRGADLEIRHEDDGMGIRPEDLDQLFGMCFTTRSEGDHGFGLSIVQKLVQAHGGTVRAESDGPGRGARFVLTLPEA